MVRVRLFFTISFFVLATQGCGVGPSERDVAGAVDQNVTVLPVTEKNAATTKIKFSPAPTPTVYRFAKYSSGAYFYTGSDDEAQEIIKNYPDFRFEGHAFAKDDAPTAKPVFRFANLRNGGYFYTGSTEERDLIIATIPHFRFEGSTFSVSDASLYYADPVYRLANLTNGAYLYTQSAAERDYAVGLGVWRYEGTTFAAEAAIPNGQSVFPAAAFYDVPGYGKVEVGTFEAIAGWFFPFQSSKRVSALRTARAVVPDFSSQLSSFPDIGCKRKLSSFVIEQENTITYSAAEVSIQDHIEAATHAEQAAVLRKKAYQIGSQMSGFNGEKVLVCVQQELAGGREAITYGEGPTNGQYFKMILASSASTVLGGIKREQIVFGQQWSYQQTRVRNIFRHEMEHVYYLARHRNLDPNFSFDVWLTEGLAKHAEAGKIWFPKSTLLVGLKDRNPLFWSPSNGNFSGQQYLLASTIVDYLLSPNGANNSLSAFTAMADQMAIRYDDYITRGCYYDLTRPGCQPYAANGNQVFVEAFEANIKEKDGTPMRLLTGSNNLRDTIVQRMEAFW